MIPLPAEPNTFKLVPATPRAGLPGTGIDVAPDVAPKLTLFVQFKTNFRPKGQDEVHVKCQASTDYAVFRNEGTWTFKGLVSNLGQAIPSTVDAAAVTFELHALLLYRKEATLEEKVGKAAVIRRGKKNRESSVRRPPQQVATVTPLPSTVGAAEKALEFVARKLPDSDTEVMLEVAAPVGVLRTMVSKTEQTRRLDQMFDIMRGSLTRITATALIAGSSQPADLEVIETTAEPVKPVVYRTVRKQEFVLLVQLLVEDAIKPGAKGCFDIRALVDAMAAGNILGLVHVVYNCQVYVKFRAHAQAYLKRHRKLIEEKYPGRELKPRRISVEVGKDERGDAIFEEINHYELASKNGKV